MTVRQHRAAGLDHLRLVTRLLQRARLADPDAGIWEAADLQWSWRRDQHADPERQVFWLDADGDPLAAVVMTEWGGGRWGCDTILVPGLDGELTDEIWAVALDLVARCADGETTGDGTTVDVVARDDDPATVDRLRLAGFAEAGEVATTTSMAAGNRPAVPPLAKGFALRSRADEPTRPHHMVARNGEHVAARLAECSLYRPELDLVVRTDGATVAAYGLFWADPVTGVGLVEPMRTEDEFQRLGLARHVLAAGLERLAAAGCTPLVVTYLHDNPTARRLYLGAGFRPGPVSRTYRLQR